MLKEKYLSRQEEEIVIRHWAPIILLRRERSKGSKLEASLSRKFTRPHLNQ
jgi:hypothetical protein